MPIAACFPSVTSDLSVYMQHILFLPASESEDALLKMSVPHTDSATPALPDFSRMTEDEQIAYALQMSMQGAGAGLPTFVFFFFYYSQSANYYRGFITYKCSVYVTCIICINLYLEFTCKFGVKKWLQRWITVRKYQNTRFGL